MVCLRTAWLCETPPPPENKKELKGAGIGDMEVDKEKQGLSVVQVFTEGGEAAGLRWKQTAGCVCWW